MIIVQNFVDFLQDDCKELSTIETMNGGDKDTVDGEELVHLLLLRDSKA